MYQANAYLNTYRMLLKSLKNVSLFELSTQSKHFPPKPSFTNHHPRTPQNPPSPSPHHYPDHLTQPFSFHLLPTPPLYTSPTPSKNAILIGITVAKTAFVPHSPAVQLHASSAPLGSAAKIPYTSPISVSKMANMTIFQILASRYCCSRMVCSAKIERDQAPSAVMKYSVMGDGVWIRE